MCAQGNYWRPLSQIVIFTIVFFDNSSCDFLKIMLVNVRHNPLRKDRLPSDDVIGVSPDQYTFILILIIADNYNT